MAVYKDKNGTWYVSARYDNWQGEHARKVKRGFKTKKDAMEWERDFLLEKAGSLDMSFEAFVELYKTNLKERLKQSTWQTKISIIDNKILPYFRKKRMTDIKVSDVVAWQNKLLNMADENGARYSLVYLKTVHNQLSAIFNHAVRFYDLPTNPAAKAGNMGKEKTREMLYWTKDEYIKFSEEIMDKPVSFYAFEMLYWCGLRLGEMLALTPADFNFEKGIVRINKSYQRIGSEDVITDPKTEKSNRNVQMPSFLMDEIKGYAIVEGSESYEVEFEYRNGEIGQLICSCFCSYNCKHEFAAMLQLKETLELIGKNYADEYERTGYFAAINKGTLFAFAIDGKDTGNFIL